jgi:plastocyanin
MMSSYGPSGSFAWLYVVGAMALIGLVAAAILLVVGRSATDESGAILAERLARGEIGPDDYSRMREALRPGSGRVPGVRWLGGALAAASLATIVVLVGLMLSGTLPRPGPGSAEPGSSGFVPGTVVAPRVVRIVAGPDLRFYPDVSPIVAGETITFEITTMGITPHEFMVGPAAAVAADAEGTPEVADVGMMQTKTLTYTFTGSGPFAFACHAPGHFEAGMKGTIAVVP